MALLKQKINGAWVTVPLVGGSTITVDDTLSNTSKNPVQNKVIKNYVDSEILTHKHTVNQITDFPDSMPASDVYDWAKTPTKPEYKADEVGALPLTGGTMTGAINMGSQ